MTGLLTWRNPQGREDDMLGGRTIINNKWEHRGKLFIAEVGVGLLALTSIIETVAYGALSLGLLPLYPFTNKPCKFFAKHLQSSSFTIFWALGNLVRNLSPSNLTTHESFVRFKWNLLRKEDDDVIQTWRQQRGIGVEAPPPPFPVLLMGDLLRPDPLLDSIQDREESREEQLDKQGANFIVHEVLRDVDNKTIDAFKDTDATTSIYSFILTKAVYIYAAGTKKNEEIPHFFKPETRRAILAFRQELINEETLGQLQQLTKDLAHFDKEPESETVQSAFNKLKGIGAKEMQNSRLLTECWKQANSILSKNA